MIQPKKFVKSQRDIARRHKICAFCHVEFCDISKRPDAGRCCSREHVKALMVQTRHMNGSYNVSQEQKAKQVATIRHRYGSFSACQTIGGRKRNSERLRLAWASGDMSRKTQETSLTKFGVTHWMKTDDGKRMASKLHFGRQLSLEIRSKMSIAAVRRVRSRKDILYTSGNGRIRSDLGLYFRSNWEANYARILQFEGKRWTYESVTFELDEGTYTPDFSIEGEGFVEIKGRVENEGAMRKVRAFIKLYPTIRIKLIGPSEYDELRKHYKGLVAWEGK